MSSFPVSPRRRPTRQNGLSLVQTMLTLGAISAMSAAIYLVLSPASSAAQTKIEQDNLRTLSRSVDQSFGLLGSFEGVSTDRILDDGLAPRAMREAGGLQTEWGAPVTVASTAIANPHDSFVVSYPNTPADVCARLASAMSRDVYDIRVNGSSVLEDGTISPGLAAQRCAAGNATMDFVFFSGLTTGTAVAAPVVLPPSAPTITPPPTSPPVITIPDAPDVDPVTPGTPATPPTAAPPPVLPPPVSPTPPPASVLSPPPVSVPPPPPVTPPGVVCSVPASWTDYEYRTPNCAANQYGVRDQRRSQEVSYSCPEAWDDPEEARTPWTSWSDTRNTCTTCPTLAPQSETRWQTSTGSCPAGQLGTVSHEYEQRRSRTRNYNCPAGTTTLPPISYGTWGSWANTGNTRNSVNTCAPACSLPNPSTETDVDTRTNTQVLSCPSGQLGEIRQSRPERRTRTRTASCPAPTGAYTWSSWSSWSSWSATGSWTTTSNTCAAVCEVPNPSTQTDVDTRTNTRTQSCPSGQWGVVNQSRPERRTRTRTASCPAPTGSFTWGAWSAWSGWSGTGSWSETSRTCKSCPAPATSDTEHRWNGTYTVACPAGQVGIITRERQQERKQTRSYSCPEGTTALPSPTYTWGSWYNNGVTRLVSDTCKPSGPATGSWKLAASSWGYGSGSAYRYWTWGTYDKGNGWCGDGGERPPQGPQSCTDRPRVSDSCKVGDWMMYEENEGGMHSGVQGYDRYECQ